MVKFLLRSIFLITVIFTFVIIYLIFFGVETERFDSLIKKRANEVNQHVKLEFKKTKIHFNPKELNLVVKLQTPKILIKRNIINLSKLDLFLPLRSFVTSDFLLKRAEVAFYRNDIKDLTKITNIFIPKIINKRLSEVFKKGNLEGQFVIPFNSDGSIGENYAFSGKIIDASIYLTKQFAIKNLDSEINHVKSDKGDVFKIIVKKGNIYNIELANSTINLTRDLEKTKVKSLIKTNGEFNFSQIKNLTSLFDIDTNKIKELNGKINLKTSINFDLINQFKVKNLSYSTEGDISRLEIHTEEKSIIKKYFPLYSSKIILKDNKIKFIKSKSEHTTKLEGKVKVKDLFDNFKINETYNYNKNIFEINGFADLTNSAVKITQLNYNKDPGKKSELSFNVNFILNKYYKINNLNFLDNKTILNLINIEFNNKFEINDFNKVKIKTFSKKNKNNDFLVEKSQKVIVSGEIFDAQPLLKSLYKKSNKKTFSKKFNSEIKINFSKVISGTNDDVSNLVMLATINKGSYEKLSLRGYFSKNEILEISIYQIDKDKKALRVISDRARPFVKNFDFIKGFEGGKLNYETIISKQVSNSNLTITNFKVSKVPALAKLLTLASLQGIADTLSGEGIRFESFEMKSNSKDNILNIEDALAIGPAVSILLDGYVDKGKIVSLSGTLVPATKLNSIIAAIPIVGDILVGKKSGEGVVGVSFKMKGPPKDIKTTVNPIKTLTPRFIVRALEKIKKREAEETK